MAPSASVGSPHPGVGGNVAGGPSLFAPAVPGVSPGAGNLPGQPPSQPPPPPGFARVVNPVKNFNVSGPVGYPSIEGKRAVFNPILITMQIHATVFPIRSPFDFILRLSNWLFY